MSQKPVILVGRKLPEAVEARLSRDYDAILNPDDTLYSADDLVAKSAGIDVSCPVTANICPQM